MITSFKSLGQNGGGGGYVLPVATSSVLGGVKIGSGLTITSGGTLSADAQPVGIATTAQTGVVKIGDGINVDSAGTISIGDAFYAEYSSILEDSDGGDLNVVNHSGGLYNKSEVSNGDTGLYDYYVKSQITELSIEFKVPSDFDFSEAGKIFGITYGYVTFDANFQQLRAAVNPFNIVIDNSQDNITVVNGENTIANLTFIYQLEEIEDGYICRFNFPLSWQDDMFDDFESDYDYTMMSLIAQELIPATNGDLGLVKIGSGITVDSDGTISVSGGTGGGLSEVQLPFGSYIENKQIFSNERPLNKGFKFEFNIGDGQWTLNPVLGFRKMYSNERWNNSGYIDMYLEKKSNDSTPHFYVIVANSVGNGNQNTTIINEHLPFDFIQQENSVSYNIPSFTFSGMTSKGTEDYTIEGMVATIKDKGDGGYELIFDNSNCSVENQANTYMNQFYASDDYLNYNDNVYAVASTFGWDFKADENNYGVVKVGNGLYIDNGALTVAFPQTRQIERRFLICTDGIDGNGADAPFVCQDDTPVFDPSSPVSEFVLYDTMIYSDVTQLFTLAYEEDDGEGNMETIFTATIYGAPEGYYIEWNNVNDDNSGYVECLNFNAYEITGGQEQFEDCNFYAAKINNGLMIHFVNVGINNYTLPKDGDDNDIYFTRGAYSDTVYVSGYQCNCMVNDDTMAIEYPNIYWDLVNPNIPT